MLTPHQTIQQHPLQIARKGDDSEWQVPIDSLLGSCVNLKIFNSLKSTKWFPGCIICLVCGMYTVIFYFEKTNILPKL